MQGDDCVTSKAMPTKLKIVWNEVSRIESFAVWGKNGKRRAIQESVHFNHKSVPAAEEVFGGASHLGGQVASSVGYDWWQGKSDSVTVYILKPDATVFMKAGLDGANIVAEVKEAVQFFFGSEVEYKKGTIERGKVTGIING
jgi:hypothetical protein